MAIKAINGHEFVRGTAFLSSEGSRVMLVSLRAIKLRQTVPGDSK